MKLPTRGNESPAPETIHLSRSPPPPSRSRDARRIPLGGGVLRT